MSESPIRDVGLAFRLAQSKTGRLLTPTHLALHPKGWDAIAEYTRSPIATVNDRMAIEPGPMLLGMRVVLNGFLPDDAFVMCDRDGVVLAIGRIEGVRQP